MHARLGYKAGKIKGYQMDTGTIIIEAGKPASAVEKVVVYARVSCNENQDNLAAQAARLVGYCTAKGYQIH